MIIKSMYGEKAAFYYLKWLYATNQKRDVVTACQELGMNPKSFIVYVNEIRVSHAILADTIMYKKQFRSSE